MRTFYFPACFLIGIVLVANIAIASEQNITLPTPKGTIKGTVSIPDIVSGKMPVVLIIAGSGGTDRNGNQGTLVNNAYKMMASALAEKGIASVRYDKRGVGESASKDQKESDLRFEDYVADVKGWISMLSADKRFSRVIIAGHSEGSTIGMIAAVGNNEVDGYISIAGPARPAAEMIKEQLMAQPQEIRDMVYPMLDTLKGGDTLRNVPQMLYALFRPSVQPYMISWFKYDPSTEIKKLNVPALLVQGTTDIQVLEKDADMLSEAYPKAQKIMISNMNHVLKDCASTDKAAQVPIYSNPDLPLNKELVTTIVSFVRGL